MGTYLQQRRACESESAGESACPTWLARNGKPISNSAAHASRSRQAKAPALPGLQEMGNLSPTAPRMRVGVGRRKRLPHLACKKWEPISNSAAHASRSRQAKAPAPPGLQEMGNLSPTAPRMRVGIGRRKRLLHLACKKWGTYLQQRRACESESAGESACPTGLARNGEPISNSAAHASRSRQAKAPAPPGLQEMGTYLQQRRACESESAGE